MLLFAIQRVQCHFRCAGLERHASHVVTTGLRQRHRYRVKTAPDLAPGTGIDEWVRRASSTGDVALCQQDRFTRPLACSWVMFIVNTFTYNIVKNAYDLPVRSDRSVCRSVGLSVCRSVGIYTMRKLSIFLCSFTWNSFAWLQLLIHQYINLSVSPRKRAGEPAVYTRVISCNM